MRVPFFAALSLAGSFISIQAAQAGNIGNVFVQGGGVCSSIVGTFPLAVGTFKVSGQNVYKLSLLANISGLSQPQYIVDTLYQTGSATTGNATVFNNGFLEGPAGAVTSGSWAGTFSFDSFADFNITGLVIVTGSGSTTCTLTFSKGQAVLAF